MNVETPYPEELEEHLSDRIFKRKLVLWFYYTKGLTQKEVSEETGFATSTINDIIKKWTNSGVIEDLPRSGRTREITEKEQNMVITLQKQSPMRSAKSIHAEIVATRPCVSYNQTLTVIRENFKSLYVPYKVTLSDDNRRIE